MGALATGVRAEPRVRSLGAIRLAALRAQADARRHGRRSLRMKPRPDRMANVEAVPCKVCMPLMVICWRRSEHHGSHVTLRPAMLFVRSPAPDQPASRRLGRKPDLGPVVQALLAASAVRKA